MYVLDLLFAQLYLKMYTNATPLSGDHLILNRIKKEIRLYILHCVLTELKSILINLIYYNSVGVFINYKVDRILQLIIYRVKQKLQHHFIWSNKSSVISLSEVKWLLKYAESEDGELLKYLLNNLFFKQSGRFTEYPGDSFQPPKLFISILENVVINLADICSYAFTFDGRYNHIFFDENMMLHSNPLFLKSYTNNIYWQRYFKFTFLKPKYIYNNIYFLSILTPRGLSKKVVYLPTLRSLDALHLTTLQYMLLLYFDMVEVIYPQISIFFRLLENTFNRLP